MIDIFGEFGKIRNTDPSSGEAQALVKKLQGYITEHMYTCTKEILSGLGKMYAGGGEFTKNIDSYGGEGTAEFASQVIEIYCREGKRVKKERQPGMTLGCRFYEIMCSFRLDLWMNYLRCLPYRF
jgi:hypothetical protein